jgi:hypothetical protein
MKLTRILLASLLLAAIIGACSTTAPTEPAAAPSGASFSTDSLKFTPPAENTTQGDTTCRGGTVGSGSGRSCDPA